MAKDSEHSIISTMLGSATAGFFGRLICHPLDTCKTRIQAPPGHGHALKSVYRMFADTLREEGLRGLYRGIGAVTVGGIPATCLYFTTYEISKSKLSSNSYVSGSPLLKYFLSGMLAEAVCCVVFVPVDVVKERMQIQKQVPHLSTGASSLDASVQYRSSWHALVTTARHEGLRGIYRGYWATLLSFGPFSALYFGLYEKSKETACSFLQLDPTAHPSFELSLSCSAFAGGVASFLTSPLDMAKLRLQRAPRAVRRVSDGAVRPMQYSSFLDVLAKTYRGEAGQGGLRALYRGAMARVMFHVPNTAISMALFEQSRKWWAQVLISG